MVKRFTSADIVEHGSYPRIHDSYPRIYCCRADLVDDPPKWMAAGLQETASGYGKKLNTGRLIDYEGRLYRLYATCYSNAGSVWFTVRGRKIFVS